MHSALFANQCHRKSCLYLHRNCSRTLCPFETIALSPPSIHQPHHSQGLGEPRLFLYRVETTQVQHVWMPWVCLFSGSEHSSPSSSFLVVLCSSHFFLGPDCNGSSFFLQKSGEMPGSRKWPFRVNREQAAGLQSSSIQHPFGSTAELVTDDNLLLALVPSKLWQEQEGKWGDGWRYNPLV